MVRVLCKLRVIKYSFRAEVYSWVATNYCHFLSQLLPDGPTDRVWQRIIVTNGNNYCHEWQRISVITRQAKSHHSAAPCVQSILHNINYAKSPTLLNYMKL